MTQEYQIMKDVLGAIYNAFPLIAIDNGYECHNSEINGEDYCFERDDSNWYFNCGNKTDNKLYSSFSEAQQAAMDFQSASESDDDDFDDESRGAYTAATSWGNS